MPRAGMRARTGRKILPLTPLPLGPDTIRGWIASMFIQDQAFDAVETSLRSNLTNCPEGN